MNAGTLTDIVTFESPETVRDEFGGQRVEWKTVWKGRAHVTNTGGNRTEMNGEVVHTFTRRVKIRFKPVLTPKMRIDIEGLKYRILAMDRNRADMSATFTVELINE